MKEKVVKKTKTDMIFIFVIMTIMLTYSAFAILSLIYIGDTSTSGATNSMGNQNGTAYKFNSNYSGFIYIVQAYWTGDSTVQSRSVALYTSNGSSPGTRISNWSNEASITGSGTTNWTIPDTTAIVLNGTDYFIVFNLTSYTSGATRFGETAGSPQVYFTTNDRGNQFQNWDSFAGGDIQRMNVRLWGESASNPFVILRTPANYSQFNGTNVRFNASSIIQNGGGNISNMTIIISYANGSTYYTNTTIINQEPSNSTNWTISGFPIGNYVWNVESCKINSTISTCAVSLNNFSFDVGAVVNLHSYNGTTYETSRESFNTNLTIPGGSSISSATLYYDGTAYSGAVTSIGGQDYLVSRSLDVPTSISSKNWFWSVLFNTGVNQNLTPNTQTISPANLTICGSAPQNIPYLNFTFKDESNLTVLNASITSSTFSYYLGQGSVNKTLSYSNSEDRFSYAFCFAPQNRSVNIDTEILYKKGSQYPQRSYNPTTILQNNITTNTTLYLLSSGDGLYITFQVINTAEQPIEGVTITGTRLIDSVTTVVASGTTDAAGSGTFWLNPDILHTFNFTKSGYDTLSTSLFPTQTSYTITLGGSTTEDEEDLGQGISITTTPANDFVDRNTTYNFTYTISSSFWNLDSFGYALVYSNGTIISTQSSTTSTGGTLSSLNVQTYNLSSLSMNYYYIINGTSSNGTRVWIIQSTEGRDFSIFRFFQDLTSYTNAGLFGFDSFGNALLAVVILVVSVGMLSMRYGLVSEAGIMGMVFGIVFFLDVGIGLIPSTITVGNLTSMNHFITFVTAIILISVIIREEIR